MPRLSQIEILRRGAFDKLAAVRNKLSPRTYTSLHDKITTTNRRDTMEKLNKQLSNIAEYSSSGNQKLTLKDIKAIDVESTRTKLNRRRVIDEAAQQNVFVSSKRLDKIKFFTKYGFTYRNVATLEDLYNNIKYQMKHGRPNRQPYTSVTLHLRNRETRNKVRSISLAADDMTSFRDFEKRIMDIAQGKVAGSDPINLSEDEIILTNFALSQALFQGEGKSCNMLFKTVGITETVVKKGKKEVGNGDCAILCLKHLGHEFEPVEIKVIRKRDENDEEVVPFIIDIEKEEDLRDPYNLALYLDYKNLPIKLALNTFTIKGEIDDVFSRNGEVEKMIDEGKNKRRRVCTPLYTNDVYAYFLEHSYKILNREKINHTNNSVIIYDDICKHFDVYSGSEIKVDVLNNCGVRGDKTLKFITMGLNDGIFMSLSLKIIKDDKIIFTAKNMNTNHIEPVLDKPIDFKYLFFDYETVIDFEQSSCMRPYSLSILCLTKEELEHLEKLDSEENLSKISEIRNKKCVTFLGYDCNKQFIEWFITAQVDTTFCFVGFNNTNFDNFLLLESLLQNENDEISVSNIFYNGSSLHNFRICGRHDTFDIHKHLMGSLKANCESFKIRCCAKKSFDHNKAQQLYADDKLIEFITGNEELREYNEYDVLATAVLFKKYQNALNHLEATYKYAGRLHEIKTVGSLIYKVFDDSKDAKKYKLPKLSYQYYKDIQQSKIAGRVEMFNGVQNVNERLASTDVCSLYPYVMSVHNGWFPCGDEIVEVGSYQGDDTLGFYYCDIDQSKLRERNLPNIYAKKSGIENDWSYTGLIENYMLSNVMIGLLKKYGCIVAIRNGFIFPEKKKSCDMFDFILDFMKAKNDQDTLKSKKDPSYNSALRETLKLLMNSLSGKVIEGLHCEKTEDVPSIAEFDKIKKKAKTINTINTIGNKIFVSYEVDEESLCAAQQRPIYLGVLIYDYAKRYMFEYSYSKIGLDQLLYTDTDASKFRYKKFLEWKQWVDTENVQVPHWAEVEDVDPRYRNHKIYESGSKVFGSFEDELEDMVGENYTFYCLEKKSWLYDVDGHSKFRFKGLNGSAQMLSLEEDFIASKKIKKGGISETKYYIKEGTEEEVHNFFVGNSANSIGAGNEVKFFKQLYDTREAYVLCSSFRKIVKNLSHNVDYGETERYNDLMNKIQVNYMMKRIRL